jgi:hypothetical protein
MLAHTISKSTRGIQAAAEAERATTHLNGKATAKESFRVFQRFSHPHPSHALASAEGSHIYGESEYR